MVRGIDAVGGGQASVQGLRGDGLAQQLKALGLDEGQAKALGDASKTMNNLDLEKMLKGILQALQERMGQQQGPQGAGGSGGGCGGGGGSAAPVDNAQSSSQPSDGGGGGGGVDDSSQPELKFNPETGKWEVQDDDQNKDKVPKGHKPHGAHQKPAATVSVSATGGKGGK